MIIVGSGFLPLFYGGTFPGDISKDTEARMALEKNIKRLIEWTKKNKEKL